jgi:hypothetical protein
MARLMADLQVFDWSLNVALCMFSGLFVLARLRKLKTSSPTGSEVKVETPWPVRRPWLIRQGQVAALPASVFLWLNWKRFHPAPQNPGRVSFGKEDRQLTTAGGTGIGGQDHKLLTPL